MPNIKAIDGTTNDPDPAELCVFVHTFRRVNDCPIPAIDAVAVTVAVVIVVETWRRIFTNKNKTTAME